MRVAIIGGTGSIGMATAGCVARRGIPVVILSRRRPADVLQDDIFWSPVDVTDGSSVRQALAMQRVDRVVHLAALLQFACDTSPSQAVHVNVDGMLNVLEACRDLGISRLVFGSSVAVYGERSDLMRETDPAPANIGLYGLTKRLGEMLGERFRALHGLEFVALRYSGVTGRGVASSAGMAKVRQRLLECAGGRDIVIEGASGYERTHLTFLADAAGATCSVLLANHSVGSVYNVAGPPENYVSLRELHSLIREIRPAAGRASWSGSAQSLGPVDVSLIAKDLAWKPSVSLSAGLGEILLDPQSASSPVI